MFVPVAVAAANKIVVQAALTAEHQRIEELLSALWRVVLTLQAKIAGGRGLQDGADRAARARPSTPR
jgi:hypothetical protein